MDNNTIETDNTYLKLKKGRWIRCIQQWYRTVKVQCSASPLLKHQRLIGDIIEQKQYLRDFTSTQKKINTQTFCKHLHPLKEAAGC